LEKARNRKRNGRIAYDCCHLKRGRDALLQTAYCDKGVKCGNRGYINLWDVLNGETPPECKTREFFESHESFESV